MTVFCIGNVFHDIQVIDAYLRCLVEKSKENVFAIKCWETELLKIKDQGKEKTENQGEGKTENQGEKKTENQGKEKTENQGKKKTEIKGKEKTENKVFKLPPGNFEKIFIPVNHKNIHWTLLVSNIFYILRYICHASPRV